MSTYIPKAQKLSFLATPEQRFDDALASLDYMLLREIPREWSLVRTFALLVHVDVFTRSMSIQYSCILTSVPLPLCCRLQNHTSSLLSFLHILTHVFPTTLPHAAATLSVYKKLIGIIEDDLSSPGKFLTDKIINHISKLRPQSPQVKTKAEMIFCSYSNVFTNIFISVFVLLFVQWKVCGRMVAPTTASQVLTLPSNKTGNLRSRVASPVSLHPAGRHARLLKKATTSGSSNNNINYNVGSIISYGADGYPCGLWFLFHYLSGRLHCHHIKILDIYYISDCLICAPCQKIIFSLFNSSMPLLFSCSLFFFFFFFLFPVASADPRYGFQYTAEEVLRSIYNLAKHFFACYDCR